MMLESNTTKRQLIEQFLDTLRALPAVQAELDYREHDAQIDLLIAGKSCTVLIEVKKAVYPRDVREVLWRFREISHNRPKAQSGIETVSVLVAESISPGPRNCSGMSMSGTTTAAAACSCPHLACIFTSTNHHPKRSRNRYGLCFPGGARRCCTPC